VFSCKYAETLMTYNKQQRPVHSELHKCLLLAFFPEFLPLLCFHILIIHLDKFLLISFIYEWNVAGAHPREGGCQAASPPLSLKCKKHILCRFDDMKQVM